MGRAAVFAVIDKLLNALALKLRSLPSLHRIPALLLTHREGSGSVNVSQIEQSSLFLKSCMLSFLVGLLVFSVDSLAQTPSPTQEQLQIFRSLPQDQQQSIMEA